MPRERVRKTSRGQTDLSKYKDAYEEVKTGESLRKAAEKHGLNHCSLLRYIRKRNVSDEQENLDMGYKAHNRVFNEVQERELSKYLIRCADIYFGLPKKEARKLAYEFAVKYNLSRPKTWDDNELAGEEWFRMFMRRNPELSLCAAQATSLSRATSFNKTNVDSFYDNLTIVMDRRKFEPQDIYNADEIGITTVQKPDRVVARRDAHQEGSVTSAEKGTGDPENTTESAVSITNPPENETPALSPSLLNYEPSADMVAQPGAINSSLVPRTEQENIIENPATPPRHHSIINIQETSPKPSKSAPTISSSIPTVFSPETIRPFPKAPLRKNNNKGRKIKKSTIYTDTPKKEEIRKEQEIRLKRTIHHLVNYLALTKTAKTS